MLIDFLMKDVKAWKDDDNYKKANIFVHSMKVVNEIVERGVALMEALFQSSNHYQ